MINVRMSEGLGAEIELPYLSDQSCLADSFSLGFCRRVKITVRKGKCHGDLMLWSVTVEDVLDF